MKRFLLIVMVLVLFTACQCGTKEAESVQTSKSKENRITKEIEIVPAKAGYEFYDDSVKSYVESYVGKTAGELSNEDFKNLSNCLKVDLYEVHTLKDIPNLFPKLEELAIICNEKLFEEDKIIFSNLNMLKRLKIMADEIPPLDFLEQLTYVELSSPRNIDLVPYLILGDNIVQKDVREGLQHYVRLKEDKCIVELVGYDTSNKKGIQSIFISEKSQEEWECKSILECPDGTMENISNCRLCMVDVNFDGKKDLLVDNRWLSGNGVRFYSCFLNEDGDYKKCKSFSNIPCPSIDIKNKKILGFSLSRDAHCWEMYSYLNGKFVKTDYLVTVHNDKEIKKGEKPYSLYNVENIIDGKKTKKSYSKKDYTEEQINSLFWKKGSLWELGSDKWEQGIQGGK